MKAWMTNFLTLVHDDVPLLHTKVISLFIFIFKNNLFTFASCTFEHFSFHCKQYTTIHMYCQIICESALLLLILLQLTQKNCFH